MRSEWLALLVAGVLLAGCYEGDPDPLRESVVVGREGVTALAVTAPAVLIEVGASQALVATATTAGGSADLSAAATWSSSNPMAVVVDGRGRVTGLRNGTATITARLGLFSDSIDITASDAQLLSIAVSGAASIDECADGTYSAAGTYEDATVRDVTALAAWSTSNTTVARMSTLTGERNRLFAREAGTVEVFASRAGILSPGYPVTVEDSLEAIAVAPATGPALAKGATRQYTATGTWAGGSADISRAATWSVANDVPATPVIASVLNGDTTPGLLTALSGGEGTVSATCGGLADAAALEVVALESLAITNTRPIELAPGGTLLLALQGTYSDGSTRSLNEQATWSVSRVSGVAVTVSNTAGTRGRVTAGNDVGLSSVTATADGKQVQVDVSVVR